MILVLPAAFVVFMFVSFFLFFMPCLIILIKTEYDKRRQTQLEKEEVLKNLPRIPYGSV